LLVFIPHIAQWVVGVFVLLGYVGVVRANFLCGWCNNVNVSIGVILDFVSHIKLLGRVRNLFRKFQQEPDANLVRNQVDLERYRTGLAESRQESG